MAGSIARRPFRIGMLLLLLAVTIGVLLILQFTCSQSDGQSTISQTGGTVETLESGGAATVTGDTAGDPSPVPAGVSGLGGTGTGASTLFTAGATGAGLPGQLPQSGDDQPAPGSLSGLVEDDLGAPLTGISVYLADGDGSLTGEFTVTDATGRFSFQDRMPGSYKLYFSDPAAVYEPGWYGARGSPSGTSIQVASGSDISIKHAMEPALNPAASSITGRVTSSCGTPVAACEAGVANVLVMAMHVKKDNGLQMTLRGTALTDSNGYYRIDNLLPGDYMVSFNPPRDDYAFQWYRGQQSFSTAEILPLLPGETIGKVDALLVQGGTISGTVTGASEPLYLALVDIYDDDGVIVDSTSTGPAGLFTSSRLPEGEYRLKVRALSSDYLGEWYSDKQDFASADAVLVSDGTSITGISIDLAAAPPAQATVTDPAVAGPPAVDPGPGGMVGISGNENLGGNGQGSDTGAAGGNVPGEEPGCEEELRPEEGEPDYGQPLEDPLELPPSGDPDDAPSGSAQVTEGSAG